MNLVDGRVLDTKACDAVLDTLESRILATLQGERLDPEWVVAACGRLVETLDESFFLRTLADLGFDEDLARGYLDDSRLMFGEAYLRERMRKELGEGHGRPTTFVPFGGSHSVTERLEPLGTLLHIAAGNADGLPAFSVLEGLLTGNLNILKLPAAEGGISIHLLQELIRIEPRISPYVYVFDYSSRDVVQIAKLVAVADAIVVWGGAEAVAALRKLAGPDTKLIEWGHKVSFAYVTAQGRTTEALAGLARNIVETGQLLCSSCQGIYVDVGDTLDAATALDTASDFCRQFLPVLETAVASRAKDLGLGLESQIALQVYTEELESVYTRSRVFRGAHCSLIAYPDRDLNPSIQFGNAWVKALPRTDLLATLRPYKGFLQSVGLLCGDGERDELTRMLWRTGVVRVCTGERMSTTYCGAAHDGEHPLRRYTRIVSAE
jgi:hypothetical protein